MSPGDHLTPEQTRELTRLFNCIYGIVSLSMVACGFQMVLCARTLGIYLALPSRSESRKTKKYFVIANFIILGLFITLAVAYSFSLGSHFVGHSEGLSHLVLGQAMATWSLVTALRTAASCLLPVVGDGVLLYRCIVLYQNKRWWLLLPGAIYLGLIIMVIATIIRCSLSSFDDAASKALVILTASWPSWPSLSMASNVVMTAYLIYPLLRMRYDLARMSSPPRSVTKPYTKVVTMLVESAFPLAFAAVATCIVFFSRSTFLMFPYAAWLFLTALCPQIIIYRVISGDSWATHEEVSFETVSQGMVFHQMPERSDSPDLEVGVEGGDLESPSSSLRQVSHEPIHSISRETTAKS